MITKNMRLALVMAGVFAGSFAYTGCKKNDNNNNDNEDKYTVSGNANGAQETPATTTNGTGTISGQYDTEKNELTYTINWTGLTANTNNMHFHGPALPGAGPAGVQIGITGFPTATSGTVSGTAQLTETQEADLMAGKWYYNIHTPTYPGGEIRGQVTLTHR